MKSEKIYNLSWTGPLYLTGKSHDRVFWDSNEAMQCKGIYALAWPIGDEFYAHYIGMTEQKFIKRISQHIQNYLCGNYYLYSVEELNKQNIKYLYNPNDRFELFLKDLNMHLVELEKYLNTLTIFIAPLNYEKEDLFIIEANLSKMIIDKKLNMILDSPDPKKKLLADNIVIKSSGSVLIKGF